LIPTRLVAGDTLQFDIAAPRAADGTVLGADAWTLKFVLVPRFATPVQAAVTITASADDKGTDYTVLIGPTTTATWNAGAYSWRSVVEQGSPVVTARQTLEGTPWQGEIEILPMVGNLAQGHDGRTQAMKALADAEAALASLMTASHSATGVIEVAVGDRRTRYGTVEEARAGLVRAINFWQARVAHETARNRLAVGLGAGSGLQVRF